MAKTKKFYGVAGTNGYGVYDDWGEVMRAKPHIKKFKNKGFDNYEEAEEYAYAQFISLQYGADAFYQIDEITELNGFNCKKVKKYYKANKTKKNKVKKNEPRKTGHSFFERNRQEVIQSQKKVQICEPVMSTSQPIQTPMVSERTQSVLTPVRQMVKPFTIDVPKQEKLKMVKTFTIDVQKPTESKMVKPFTIGI